MVSEGLVKDVTYLYWGGGRTLSAPRRLTGIESTRLLFNKIKNLFSRAFSRTDPKCSKLT